MATNHQLRTTLAVALVATLALALFASGAGGNPQEEVDETAEGASYAAGELVVVYEPDVVSAAAENLPDKSGGKVEEEIPELDAQVVEFPEVKNEPTEAQREQLLDQKKEELEQAPEVKSASYNYVYEAAYTPNDPRFGDQYGLKKIQAPRAWNKTRGAGVNIAVVDTGIAGAHPDLRAKIADQRNFTEDPETTVAEDDSGHGTAVAGVAAATTNNGAGIAGACPDCRLLIAKSLDANREGTADDVAQGIEWAADNGAEAINLSLGAQGADSPVVKEAIDRAVRQGAVVVASAGNYGDGVKVYPAAYENVIAVAATNERDRRAAFSSYGNWVDVAAPGTNILSTRPPAGYGRETGTSFASPHVAGAAGLLAAQGRPAREIRNRLESTARDLGPDGKDQFYGHGLVDAAAAVGARKPPPNTKPRVSNPRPKPGSQITSRTPTIRATVKDRETNLRKGDITLILDGKKRGAFKYNRRTDQLSFTPKRQLARGRHTVRVVARDGQGGRAVRKWSFRVKPRATGPLDRIRQPGFPFNVLPQDRAFDRISQGR